jgi:hypothetical protein
MADFKEKAKHKGPKEKQKDTKEARPEGEDNGKDSPQRARRRPGAEAREMLGRRLQRKS